MVRSACPVNWKDESVRQKCQDEDQSHFLRNLPVFDKNNNRTYRNIFCASCNGAENTTYWQLTLTCQQAFNVTNLNFISILDLLKKDCSSQISPKKYQSQDLKTCIPRFQDCFEVTQKKNESYCQNECLRYSFPVCFYNETITRFRNLQCALCNGLIPRYLAGKCVGGSGPVSPPLTIIFDFRSTSKYKIQAADDTGSIIKSVDTTVTCPFDEVFDPYILECKKMSSPIPLRGLQDSNKSDTWQGTCTFISFNQSDYVLFSNNSVYLRPHNKIYDNTTYTIHGNSLLLCVNFSRNATVTEKERNDIEITATPVALQLLTSIGCIVSTVSLVLLLMTYILFPELRNLPGKIVINLASSLLLYQVVFFLAVDTSDKVRCMAVAVLLHFFALSSFAWMNVMAFDIHRTFTTTGDVSRGQDGQQKRLIKYSLYSWMTPVLVVVICLVVDHVEDGSVGYGRGEDNCFISRPQALLYSFVLPVGLLMLFNLFALGHTLIHIVKTRKAAQRVTNQRPGSSIAMICVKMVSVMGVTWLLGVAANFQALSFLWYPFVVLNSLQGFFIFLSFAVSGRALQLYKSKMTKVLRLKGNIRGSIDTSPSTINTMSNRSTRDTGL